MPPNINSPFSENRWPGGDVPPPLNNLSPPTKLSAPVPRPVLALFLNLFVGLFLVDGFFSLADDSLLLFFGVHWLSVIRIITGLLALLLALLVYDLMAFTPAIPKRWFVPLALFFPAAQLLLIPFLIYCFDQLAWVEWSFSGGQVILGLWILQRIQGRWKFRWPLVPLHQIAGRCFSGRTFILFTSLNLFILLPAVILYLFIWTAISIHHYTDGFMTLRPDGFVMQARKYVRDDGKVIQLFPMSHVADADFYEKISKSFPTNSIILMEGVSDEKNLLTNGISYQRMARSLGLAEQQEKFAPTRGKVVPADVDVDQFSSRTIALLNLVMLVHARGLNASTLMQLLAQPVSPQTDQALFNDILHKRNQHLLEEIQIYLPQTDDLIVPWGVAHMPGIAAEIQKAGFHLEQTQEYIAIRFHG